MKPPESLRIRDYLTKSETDKEEALSELRDEIATREARLKEKIEKTKNHTLLYLVLLFLMIALGLSLNLIIGKGDDQGLIYSVQDTLTQDDVQRAIVLYEVDTEEGKTQKKKSQPRLVQTIGVIVAISSLGGIAAFYTKRQNSIYVETSQLNLLKAREKILSDPVLHDRENNHSDFNRLVAINIENLAEYYEMIKLHTDKSFTFALISGITGFLLIITGLAIGLVSGKQQELIAYIGTATGIITEFISGIFFYLYNKTVRELKGYHDSLLKVQNTLLAFKLLDDIGVEDKQIEMIAKIIGFLMQKTPSAGTDENESVG